MKSFGPRKSGIYCVRVNGIPYVGKDSEIQRLKRIKSHKSALEGNYHWNKEMQEEYNKTNSFSYEVLLDLGKYVEDKELCDLEIEYIEKLDSYNNGFNKTLGGIGGRGVLFSEERLELKSIQKSGDNHHFSKTSLEDFKAIVGMFEAGYSNKQIAEKFNLHDRYVSLIRHKKRYIRWFREYFPEYQPVYSREGFVPAKLTKEQVKEIFIKVHSGASVSSLAKEYSVGRTSIYNIKNQKSYKEVTKDLFV